MQYNAKCDGQHICWYHAVQTNQFSHVGTWYANTYVYRAGIYIEVHVIAQVLCLHHRKEIMLKSCNRSSENLLDIIITIFVNFMEFSSLTTVSMVSLCDGEFLISHQRSTF